MDQELKNCPPKKKERDPQQTNLIAAYEAVANDGFVALVTDDAVQKRRKKLYNTLSKHPQVQEALDAIQQNKIVDMHVFFY